MYRYLSDFELVMQVECDLRSTERERELAKRLRNLALSADTWAEELEAYLTSMD